MFELTQDHEEFRHLVRDFAEAEITPKIAEWDKQTYFPVELMPKLGELGAVSYTHLTLPTSDLV